MKRTIIAALGIALAITLFYHAAFANPFISGRPSDVNAGFMESFTTPFLHQIIAMQRQIHELITSRIEALKEGQSFEALWDLLLISFGYGIFHVLAPGHGKVIIGSYFLGNKSSWQEGVWAGLLMAAGHTLTAMGVVGVLYLCFGLGQFAILNDAKYMELAGYGLIAAIGIWLLIRAVTGRKECGVCGHEPHHHAHHRGHKHTHEHNHVDADHEYEPEKLTKPSASLFAAASLVPCTGSMIILLFTLANNVLWAGMLAVVSIALGMWLTVTAIGITSMLLRRMVIGDENQISERRSKFVKAARIVAALVVISTGCLLFAGTLYSMTG